MRNQNEETKNAAGTFSDCDGLCNSCGLHSVNFEDDVITCDSCLGGNL